MVRGLGGCGLLAAGFISKGWRDREHTRDVGGVDGEDGLRLQAGEEEALVVVAGRRGRRGEGVGAVGAGRVDGELGVLVALGEGRSGSRDAGGEVAGDGELGDGLVALGGSTGGVVAGRRDGELGDVLVGGSGG